MTVVNGDDDDDDDDNNNNNTTERDISSFSVCRSFCSVIIKCCSAARKFRSE